MPFNQFAAQHAMALGAFLAGMITTYLVVATGLIVPDPHLYPDTNHHVHAPSFQELFETLYDSYKPSDVTSNPPLLPTISVVIEDATSVYPLHNESKIRTMVMYTDQGDPIGVNTTNVKLETLVITDEIKKLEQATLQQFKRQILDRFVDQWRREIQDMVERHSTILIILKFMYELTIWAVAELLLKFDVRHHIVEMYGLIRASSGSRHLPKTDQEDVVSKKTITPPTELEESVHNEDAGIKPESDDVKPEPDNVEVELNKIAPEPDNLKPKPDNHGFFSGPYTSSAVSQDASPVNSPTPPDSPISRESVTSIPGSHGSASFLASSPSSLKPSEPLLTPEAPTPKIESSYGTPLSGQNPPSTSEPTTLKQIQSPTEDAASIDTPNGEGHMPQGRAAPTTSAPTSGASKPAFQAPKIIPAVPRLPPFRPSSSTTSQRPASTSDAPKLTAMFVLTPPARSEDSVRPANSPSKTGESGSSPPTSESTLAGGASSRQVSSSLPAKTQLPQRSAQADAAFQATVAQLNPDGEVVKAGSGGMMSNADLYEAAAARKASVPAAFSQSTSTEVSSKPSKRAPKYEAQPYKRPAHPTSVFPKDTEPVQGYRQSNDRRGLVARPCVADRSCMNPDCVEAHRGPRVSAFSPFTTKQWCTFDEQCNRPDCYRWHRAPKRPTDWATFGGGRR